MAYLTAQIFVCLLLAALLGGLVGWLLRGRVDVPDAAALAEARQRIDGLERDLAAASRTVPSANVSDV